jgi:dTDP-4-amino-4,6-dideoxygalactose transaminase
MNAQHETIPVFDLTSEIEEQWDELMKAIEGVVRSGTFILGPNVNAFEQEIAAYLGVKHAVGVNSGTDALVISLRALGIGPGDEVITTPFTYFATAESISNVGATPVFVDIDPVTFCIDPELITPAITERTRAILPVHLYGHPADMGRITEIAKAHDLKIVEDCAQAMGAEYKGRKVGTFGQANAFSFFPSKNLGAFGDAGLVTTDHDAAADLARMLRSHGSKRKYENEILGFNSRLDELQAAILRVRLTRLEEANDGRRRVAACYNALLDGVDGVVRPTEQPNVRHVYHQYSVRITGGRRDEAQTDFAHKGIGTMVYYPVALHWLSPYAGGRNHLPESERAATEVLSLPLWPAFESRAQEAAAQVLSSVRS